LRLPEICNIVSRYFDSRQVQFPKSIEQPKLGDSIWGSHEDLAIDDQRRDELVAIAEVIASACGLVAVV